MNINDQKEEFRTSLVSAPKQRFFYGWTIVSVSVVIIAIAAGIDYSFGIFLKPISAELGWSRLAISGARFLSLISEGVFGLLLGIMCDRWGPRLTIGLGGLLLGLGMFGLSQVSTIGQFYFCYALLQPVGLAAALIPLISVVSRWFVSRRGLALGLVACGVGIGTLLICPAIGYIVTNLGWRTAYIICGLVSIVSFWTLLMPLRKEPKDIGLVPYGVENRVLVNKALPAPEEPGIILPEVLKTAAFWIMFMVYLGEATGRFMVMTHLVAYATDRNISPLLAANLLGTIGGVSIAGRTVMGFASDKIGSKNVLLICLSGMIILMFLLPTISVTIPFFIFSILFGFCYGGAIPQYPMLAANLFGVKSAGAAYGGFFLGGCIGSATGSVLAAYIFDLTGSYSVAFMLGGGFIGLAVLFISLLKENKSAARSN